MPYKNILLNYDFSLTNDFNSIEYNSLFAQLNYGNFSAQFNYLEERGVQLFHAAKGNRDAVAEHAIGSILALMNHLPKADQQVRKGIWDRERNRGEELMGKTIGIFGYGNMGTAFAKRLKGFGVKVLAYDKYKKGYGKNGVQEASWELLKQEADVLSIHVPLTPETHDFFSLEELKGFSKPFWLIKAFNPKSKSGGVNSSAPISKFDEPAAGLTSPSISVKTETELSPASLANKP